MSHSPQHLRLTPLEEEDLAGAVLLVDDDAEMLEILEELLEPEFETFTATSAHLAREILSEHPVAVVVSDQQMPGETGIDFLSDVRRRHPRTQRVLLTGYSERRLILDAINRGAVHSYLIKENDIATLRKTVREAMREWKRRTHAQLQELENTQLRATLASDGVLTRRLETFMGRATHTVLVLSIATIGFAVLAVAAFALLYLMKATLGIDLFRGMHLM